MKCPRHALNLKPTTIIFNFSLHNLSITLILRGKMIKNLSTCHCENGRVLAIMKCYLHVIIKIFY